MSSIVDVYLHGPVHLTNPGLEDLLADTLSQGMSRSLLGPRGPADSNSDSRLCLGDGLSEFGMPK